MKLFSTLFIIVLTGCSHDGDFAANNNVNLNPYNESRPVEVVFRELIDTIEQLSGKSTCLNKPATDDAIMQAEIAVGEPFPEDVKTIYKLADGQKDTQNCAPIFLEGYHFMSLKYVVQQWTLMKQLYDQDKDFGALYDKQGAVNGYHWTPKWIPLGFFMSGDFICIDNEPTASGFNGQIIEFIHDDIPRTHLAVNFNAYLGYILKNIASEKIVYRQDWGVLTKHKD